MSEPNIHPSAHSVLTAESRSRQRKHLLYAAGYTVSALLLQEPRAQAAEPRSTNTSVCARGVASAISELGCELAHQIKLAQPTLVVAAPPLADAKLDDAARLASRLVAQVAASLGPHALGHPVPANAAGAQMAAAKHGALLYLEPSIKAGRLRVSADLYPIARGFWDRVRKPPPSASASAFAERALDPELRSFFAPIPLVARTTTLVTPPELSPIALGCGDLDLDGSPEVALVGRRRVAVGRFRGGRFVSIASKNWSELSPIAPAPLRAPLAAVRFHAGGGLDLGSSDRSQFLRLDPELAVSARAPRRVPYADGCREIAGHGLAENVVRCLPDDKLPLGRQWAADERYSQFASFVGVNGTLSNYQASPLPSHESIIVWRSQTEQVELEDAGAQLTLADLDGDGHVELLSSRATLHPAQDALRVHTLGQDGRLLEKLVVPIPDGITAITACPVGTDSMGAIVVGTLGRLWIIQ